MSGRTPLPVALALVRTPDRVDPDVLVIPASLSPAAVGVVPEVLSGLPPLPYRQARDALRRIAEARS